ncbi:MAG: hypothetical protein DRO94_02850 [Candidatus Altiarchaeales archaeon]|nr:MAG: hypothetical protein DRO95_05955 [Candidatus Altiarchaeales archaeon]RLI94451.1 MAG: hypothetical protein DRO94_02850 [Candidatus Altiarchaeales archaeon]HDO82254.1 hypothetical protein [Candidatus Altiarchaeales archaeon]HEX54903.1 hypothetical protein [Candidatus Altiarchaeales archaeon]
MKEKISRLSKIEIRIIHEKFESVGVLNFRDAPITCTAILEILPLEGSTNMWMDGIYFGIPIDVGEENQSLSVEEGDIAYYPPMRAFCIFLCRSRPIDTVNLIGSVENPCLFKHVNEKDTIRLERI